MAKRHKKPLICYSCGSIIEIYKKGKKHRVFVCPNCGIIADNPGLLTMIKQAKPFFKKGGKLSEKFKESADIGVQEGLKAGTMFLGGKAGLGEGLTPSTTRTRKTPSVRSGRRSYLDYVLKGGY